MPQTNYTPILIYASSTTGNTPAAGNLTNSAGGAELAINYFDGRLFYKDASNVVQVLATKGTGTIGGSNTQVQFNSSGALAGSSNMTFNGTTLSVNGLTVTNNPTFNGGTANGVLYLDGSKVVTSGSALTFDGSILQLANPTLGNFSFFNSSAAVDEKTYLLQTGSNVGGGIFRLRLANDALSAGVNAYVIDRTGTSIDYQAWSAGSSEAMRLNSSGNLLLGSTSVGASASPRFTALVNTGNFLIGAQGSANGAIRAGIIHNITANLGGLVFATGGDNNTDATEKMRLDSAGNLGIGLTNQTFRLEVSNASAVPVRFNRNQAGQAIGALILNQPNTTDGNSLTLRYTSDTTGAGAATDVPFAEIEFAADIHNQATRAGSIRFLTSLGGVGNSQERMRLDASGNLGLGVTPSAWVAGYKAFQVNTASMLAPTGASNEAWFVSNSYSDGSWKYISAAAATQYYQLNGAHIWRTASPGVANAAISFTQAMTLDSSGRLLIGVTSGAYAIDVGDVAGGNMFRFTRSGVELSAYTAGNIPHIGTTSNSSLILITNSTERMRLDASGNLTLNSGTGSGLPTAQTGLNVFGGASVAATTSPGVVTLGANSNSIASGQVIGRLQFYSNDASTSMFGSVAKIDCLATSNFATEAQTALTFHTNTGAAGTLAEVMRLDSSGNLGLGVTPSATQANYRSYELFGSLWMGGNGTTPASYIYTNAYFDGANKYKTSGFAASLYQQASGAHAWLIAPSGTAGNAISFTQAMTLDASGNWVVGSTNPDPFGRNDERRAAIVGGGSTDNAALSISAGASAGRGAQIYLGQTSTRHFTLSANATESTLGTVSNTPLRFQTNDTERMRLDSAGNLGLGVTPSAWFTSNNFRAIQLTNSASVHGQLAGGAFLTGISSNWFANAAGTDTYIANGFATTYRQLNGQHAWYTAPSGTAGGTISFTQAMTLDASGNLMLGTTAPNGRLTVTQDQDALTTIQINNASLGSNAGTRLTLGSQGGPSDIQSRRNGGATVITTAGVDRLTFDQGGNVVVGNAAIATTATDGFLYVPTCAGTPTGTPTTYTGRSPIVVDTTNNKLYFYSGGAWRDAGP